MEYITIANGTLYSNDKGSNDKLPDFTGPVKFELPALSGAKVQIAMWKRDQGYSFKITEIRDEE